MLNNQRLNYLLVLLCSVLMGSDLFAQDEFLELSEIMKGKDFVGYWPENPQWSPDGKLIYFDWNPDFDLADSTYVYSLQDSSISPASAIFMDSVYLGRIQVSAQQDLICYERQGEVFIDNVFQNNKRQITYSPSVESNPYFLQNNAVAFQSGNNAFVWTKEKGTIQLTNIVKGGERHQSQPANDWLAKEELSLMDVLSERKEKEEWRKKNITETAAPEKFYLEDRDLRNLSVSPNADFVFFRTVLRPDVSGTIVPSYVTNSGMTEELSARSNVGSMQPDYEAFLYMVEQDSFLRVKPDELPELKKDEFQRYSNIGKINWSPDGTKGVTIVQSLDNKDRWIAQVDLQSGQLKNIDYQHDEAWIGGPGISSWRGFVSSDIGWIDDNRIWFQSEKTGYSHIFIHDFEKGKTKPLTKGKFEIYDPVLSKDGKSFYFHSNEIETGQRHFYKMGMESREVTQLTWEEGYNEVVLSPDEKQLLIRHSKSNQPWELYLKENNTSTEAPHQITHSTTKAFDAYQWRIPEIVQFDADDGKKITARLYRSTSTEKPGPAVIFVHGAGYLQNAHKWWSSYFREYMFHNLLLEKGYTVLDIDYRGSAGYGRDWRTDIYRHMGDKDLNDHIDGARFLTEECDIDANRIGIYGGSYGGFITLMALFTKPENFACGAALRSVTDWAHYNHLYTSNILNTPTEDSTAFRRSSPIYFAEGLEDPLLICHGMIDRNVHYQDVVRLAQRLIELEKDSWELAVYPVEGHSFVEASSWTDEYRRILELFEKYLK